MIIPIDNEHRISSDTHQWIVQERKEYKGKEIWRSVAYYPRLEGVIRHIYDRKLRLSDADTLVGCLSEAEKLCKQLSSALNPIIKVDIAAGEWRKAS